MNNTFTSKTQELAGVSPEIRVLANENSSARSIRILGKVVTFDHWLDWRVKWGQRGTVVSGGLCCCCYLFNNIFFSGHNIPLEITSIMFAIGFIISMGTLYYKNVSFVITGRLLKEVTVVMVLMLGICIFVIDCVKPYNSFAPVSGFIYLFGIFLFVFVDAVKKKSRMFVLAILIIYALTTLWNIFNLTFNGASVGVILFQYGNNYVLHKRSIKRSCFIQIFLFSLNGMWTMFQDKKMEKMIFATGNIYRETGTASKYIEDGAHTERMRSETAESMV